MVGVGPYGIEQFDALGAINAYEAAHSNRIRSMLLQRQIAHEEQATARDDGVRAAMRVYAGGGDTGAASASTPAAPALPAPEAAPAVPAGMAPPATPTAPPAAPTGAGDRDLLFRSLSSIAPEQAFAVMHGLAQMDEDTFNARHRQNIELARQAIRFQPMTPEQRTAEFQRIAPDLVASGISRQMLASVDLSDNGLNQIINHAMDMDKLFEASRPHPMVEPQGGRIVDPTNIDPATGRARVLSESPTIEVGGYVYPRPPAMTTPHAPTAQTPEQLRAAAQEAIRRGADPAQVNARLEQMLHEGGASQPGSQTFP
jgi:hypothetical protein